MPNTDGEAGIAEEQLQDELIDEAGLGVEDAPEDADVEEEGEEAAETEVAEEAEEQPEIDYGALDEEALAELEFQRVALKPKEEQADPVERAVRKVIEDLMAEANGGRAPQGGQPGVDLSAEEKRIEDMYAKAKQLEDEGHGVVEITRYLRRIEEEEAKLKQKRAEVQQRQRQQQEQQARQSIAQQAQEFAKASVAATPALEGFEAAIRDIYVTGSEHLFSGLKAGTPELAAAVRRYATENGFLRVASSKRQMTKPPVDGLGGGGTAPRKPAGGSVHTPEQVKQLLAWGVSQENIDAAEKRGVSIYPED